MNLPTIQEHKELVQAVSARDLYQFLQPTERFSNWFDRQLQYGFENGVDYLGCKVFNTLAKQEVQEYYQPRRKTTPFKGWISGEFT